MTGHSGMSAPKVERTLVAAHEHLALLRQRCGELAQDIGDQHLPDEGTLAAFSLLGDHARNSLVQNLQGEIWTALKARGLAYRTAKAASTPELRLLSHVRAYIWAVQPVEARLRGASELPEPPDELWRCTRIVQGARPQRARVHFVSGTPDLRYLLIDPPYSAQERPVLWAWPPASGWFAIPIDGGSAVLTLMYRDGRMFRMRIQTKMKGIAQWK